MFPDDLPETPGAPLAEHPHLLRGMAAIALAGPVIFAIAILIADFVVPDHDWIADTISDLGAGPYEFIVDIGIYAYSAALLACAIGSAHAHLGGKGWSLGLYGLLATGLIVFLVGARNEYGDADRDGTVIHVYLVYALGVAFTVIPWAMSAGAGAIDRRLGWVCRTVTALWIPMAPVFFLMPDGWDGLYERGLGLVTACFVVAIALALLGRARAIDRW